MMEYPYDFFTSQLDEMNKKQKLFNWFCML